MPKPPKKKCCVSKPRCKRCPIRMMANGTLPDGYTVKKRKLVKVKKKNKDKKSSKSSKTATNDKPLAA
ncbi:hypothetical protein [Aeromicrobium sp.]|uniref:hypothetical protein n=1 Tax=Aeromicrobium sp. TaxID=1871063 RepID=UPI0028AFFBCD|nr:hypothetical protein [Aeromicrobium sp.]